MTLDDKWHVYLIRTKHNSLYCGVTVDLQRRFTQHQTGKGAKALKGKGPLHLVWSQSGLAKVKAMQLEYAIKQLPKITKEKIVSMGHQLDCVEGRVEFLNQSVE